MKMLVSVRSVDEARAAAAGGADFIDLKEPHDGALGALPLPVVSCVVEALRASPTRAHISATIGDGPWTVAQARERVQALAACGVDYVKVGVMPGDSALLNALGRCPQAVVPVFIVDHGLDPVLLARSLAGPFPAVMLDTADKLAGSLFDCLATDALQTFVERVQGAGKFAGLAGALRLHHVAALVRLAPDFAGFRSAVCVGSREATLDAGCLARLRETLRDAMRAEPQAAQAALPISAA